MTLITIMNFLKKFNYNGAPLEIDTLLLIHCAHAYLHCLQVTLKQKVYYFL